eukprot:scpid4703/ scgid2720/ 
MSEGSRHKELFSAAAHLSLSSRVRALRSLKFKLNFGLLTVEGLLSDGHLLPVLLSNLSRNAASNLSGDEVDEEIRSEIELSLQLLQHVSQETGGAMALYGLNAVSTLAALERAHWYHQLASTAVPGILQNLTVAVKSSIVLPALDSSAGAYSPQPPACKPADARVPPSSTASHVRPLQHCYASCCVQVLAGCARLLASDDASVCVQACRCLRVALPCIPALTLVRSAPLLEALLRRLSVHEGRVPTAAVVVEELLYTGQHIVKSLQAWVSCQSNPLTASPSRALWQDMAKNEFLSTAISLALSMVRSALPWPLINRSLTRSVASVLVTLVGFMSRLKMSLMSSPELHLAAQESEIDGTVELLARCVRHCSKELQQMRDEDDGGNGSTGPSVQASLQHFQLVLLSTLCNVLALFCPPNRPLGKIIQDAISPLLLDPFLNIAHPNVIAGLLTYARQDVVKIWRDMRHCAHSVAAARALTGMTVDELKHEENMSLRLARLCLPCLEFLCTSECKRCVDHLCRFLIPRMEECSDARSVFLGLLAHQATAVRRRVYEILHSAWQDRMATSEVGGGSTAEPHCSGPSPTSLLLLEDVMQQICLFGLYDTSPQVVDLSKAMVRLVQQSALHFRDLHLCDQWRSCLMQSLPYLQAYSGNDDIIDTGVMSLLSSSAVSHVSGLCASDAGGGALECVRLRALVRWMFSKHHKLRSWALSQLVKALVKEDASLIAPFSKVPAGTAVADIFIVASPIAPGCVATSIPADRLKELLDIVINNRLDASLRVSATQQVLSAVQACHGGRLPADLGLERIVDVMRSCMTKSHSSTPTCITLLEPCVGILAHAAECTQHIRKQLRDCAHLYLTVLRACFLAAHSKTLHSYAARLLIQLVFAECSSDQPSARVRFVSTPCSSTVPEACFWQHILERLDIRSVIKLLPIVSAHACQRLQLSDTRPDLYSLDDLKRLCNEWTELTAQCTAHTSELCDALLSQLAEHQDSSAESVPSKLTQVHLSTGFMAALADVQSARDHAAALDALRRLDLTVTAAASVASCDEMYVSVPPPEQSSLFPRCAAPCDLAGIVATNVLDATARFLSNMPASKDDFNLFTQLMTSLRCVVEFPGSVGGISDLATGLVTNILTGDGSVCMVLLRQHLMSSNATVRADLSEFEQSKRNALGALLELYAAVTRLFPHKLQHCQLLSLMAAIGNVLTGAVETWSSEPTNAMETTDLLQLSSTCLLSRVLTCLVDASSGLENALLGTPGKTRDIDYHPLFNMLRDLVKIASRISGHVKDGMSPVAASLLRSAALCISHISAFLSCQEIPQNWRQLFAVGVQSPSSSHFASSVAWMKPLVSLSWDVTVQWSCLQWLCVLLQEPSTIALVLAAFDDHDHGDNVWRLALDHLRDESLGSIVRKQACLVLIQLTHRHTLSALSSVCQQTSQSSRVQNLCTVPGLLAWLSAKTVKFFPWLHDAFVQCSPMGCGSVSEGGGDNSVSGDCSNVKCNVDAWLGCLCPLLHNLLSLSCAPVAEQLMQHNVLSAILSTCCCTLASLTLRQSCCYLLSAVLGASSVARSWAVSADGPPLLRLVACLDGSTPAAIALVVSDIIGHFFALPASTEAQQARMTVSTFLCQSWTTFSCWCRRFLSSESEEEKMSALVLLSSLLSHAHTENRQESGPVSALLQLLESEQDESTESGSGSPPCRTISFATPPATTEVTTGAPHGDSVSSIAHQSQQHQQQHNLCSRCLVMFLIETSELCATSGKRLPSAASSGHALLISLLALSPLARQQAVKAGFIGKLLSRVEECVQQLSAVALKVNLSATERRALEGSTVSVCQTALRLLQNVVYQDSNAKLLLVTGHIAVSIHRLWCWSLQHEVLMLAMTGFLLSFTSNCSQACQSLLLASTPGPSTSRSSTRVKSVIHFLVHRVTHLLSLTSTLRNCSAPASAAAANSSSSSSASSSISAHNVSLLQLCSVLANCARSTACRRVLIREGLLTRFHATGHLPLKDGVLVQCLLHICLALSFSHDGVAHLIKIPGMVDWLCDVGTSQRLSTLPSCTSLLDYVHPVALVPRLCAATVLHNIGIEHKRLLSTTDRPRNLFHVLLRSGSAREKQIANAALSTRKVTFTDVQAT